MANVESGSPHNKRSNVRVIDSMIVEIVAQFFSNPALISSKFETWNLNAFDSSYNQISSAPYSESIFRGWGMSGSTKATAV